MIISDGLRGREFEHDEVETGWATSQDFEAGAYGGEVPRSHWFRTVGVAIPTRGDGSKAC